MPTITVIFTDSLTREELIDVLLFIADHTRMAKVSNPLGRLVGVRGPQDLIEQLVIEVPRLHGLWQEVEPA